MGLMRACIQPFRRPALFLHVGPMLSMQRVLLCSLSLPAGMLQIM
jgi:hypothetical protein